MGNLEQRLRNQIEKELFIFCIPYRVIERTFPCLREKARVI